jgi:hypothetical protein
MPPVLFRVTNRALLMALPAALVFAPHALSAAPVGAPIGHASHPLRAFDKPSAAIMVANEGDGNGGSILEYPETANGNVAPSVAIGDHNGGPRGIALDPKRFAGALDPKRFAVTDGPTGEGGGHPGVETFALDATSGNLPLTAIECFPRFAVTNGVAFDTAGDLYVGTSSTIEIFKPKADNCAKPVSVISEAGTGMAIDRNDVLYVANETAATVDLFAPGASTPGARIGGANTGLVEPVSVALDAALNVYVFDFETQALSEFAAGATGDVSPIRVISGSNTGFSVLPPPFSSLPEGIAVSGQSGQVFVANPSTNAILIFAASANGNVAPIQTIAGNATGLSAPLNIALRE